MRPSLQLISILPHHRLMRRTPHPPAPPFDAAHSPSSSGPRTVRWSVVLDGGEQLRREHREPVRIERPCPTQSLLQMLPSHGPVPVMEERHFPNKYLHEGERVVLASRPG